MHEDAVLIIGGGILPSYMIQEAQAMGLKVIAVDGNPQAPGAALADAFFSVDAYDAGAVMDLIPLIQQAYHLLGVCTAGADVAYSVSCAAAAAHRPGIPRDVAARTIDKLRVRDALKVADLQRYQPQYDIYDHAIPEWWQTTKHLPLPLVVKPLRQRASRGVSIVRVLGTETAGPMVDAIQKALPYGPVMLFEECLIGTEHSAEAIFTADGSVYWFNIVDRMFDYSGGTAMELGHVNPTQLPDEAQEVIYQMAVKTAHVLGVTFGPFKVDVMLTQDGPKILECTARLSGGFDSQRTSPLTGRHPMRLALQVACGMHPEMPPPCGDGYAACAAILPTQTGRVTHLPSLPQEDSERIWCVQPGDLLPPLTHNGLRPGFVMTHAPTYEAAWGFAKHDADTLAAMLDAAVVPA